jgi:hypothetical protein
MLVLLALVASLSLVFVACGGDDDDDSSDGNGQSQDDGSSDENDQDGDDNGSEDDGSSDDDGSDDEDDGSSDDGEDSPTGSGDEEEYVADVCGALNDYIDAVFDAFADPEVVDAPEDEQLEIFEPIFADLVDRLDDADPPGDISEYHDEMLRLFENALERFRSGDVTVFDDDPTEDLGLPPADIQEKYNQIAEGLEECADTGFFQE